MVKDLPWILCLSSVGNFYLWGWVPYAVKPTLGHLPPGSQSTNVCTRCKSIGCLCVPC